VPRGGGCGEPDGRFVHDARRGVHGGAGAREGDRRLRDGTAQVAQRPGARVAHRPRAREHTCVRQGHRVLFRRGSSGSEQDAASVRAGGALPQPEAVRRGDDRAQAADRRLWLQRGRGAGRRGACEDGHRGRTARHQGSAAAGQGTQGAQRAARGARGAPPSAEQPAERARAAARRDGRRRSARDSAGCRGQRGDGARRSP